MMSTDEHRQHIRACPDDMQLTEFLMESLCDPEAETVMIHIEACDRCQDTIESLADGIEDSQHAPSARDDRTGSTDPSNPAFLEVLKTVPPRNASWRSALRPSVRRHDSEFQWQQLLDPPRLEGEIGRLGPFRLLKVIGQGGMGIVFCAEDTTLGREIALKVMKPSMLANAAARERFLREARAAASIRNDHVVTVLQVSEYNGCPVIAMELLEGESIQDRLDRNRLPNATELRNIAEQSAMALHAAHRRGLVHRDFKPANVWLESGSGRVKVLDFGLAYSNQDARLTHSGMLLGTPAYMAPEQADGRDVDARSDLFSLGAVLYHLAAGVPAFPGESTLSILSALASCQPKPVRQQNEQLPPDLADLIMDLLSADPRDRPPTGADVLARLGEPKRQVIQDTPSRTGFFSQGFVAAGLLATIALIVLFQVVVRIRHRDGTLKEIAVPAGATIEVVDISNPPRPDAPTIFDQFKSEDIAESELNYQRGGSETEVPKELVAVFGDSRLMHGDVVEDLAWHPDGKRLASASLDGAVRIWEASSGQTVKLLRSDLSQQIRSLAFNEDGTHLAVGTSQAGSVTVWDIKANRRVFRETDNVAALDVRSLAFHPKGELLALGLHRDRMPGIIRVLNIHSGQRFDLSGNRAAVRRVVFSPDGRRLYSASGSSDEPSHVIAWDVETKSKLFEFSPKEIGNLLDLDISPDGSRFAVGGTDGAANYLAESGDLIRTIGRNRSVAAIRFSSDGDLVALTGASQNGAVDICDAASGKIVRTFKGDGNDGTCVAFCPSGPIVASGDSNYKISVSSILTGQPLIDLPVRPGGVRAFDASRDGKQLLLSHTDGSISRSDTISDGNEFSRFRKLESRGPIQFADGASDFFAGAPGLIRASIATGEIRWRAKGMAVSDIDVSPDGRWVAITNTAPSSDEITVFDSNNGDEAFRLVGHEKHVTCIEFSPDGQQLASGSDDRTANNGRAIHVWDIVKREVAQTLDAPGGPVRDLAWSPSGSWIAAASGHMHQFVTVWGAEDGKLLHRFEQFDDVLIAASPDGQRLAAVDRRGRILVLNPSTGEISRDFQTVNVIVGVAFSPDSRHLITANGNGTVFVFRF